MTTLSVTFSTLLRHAFYEGAGYNRENSKISDADLARWVDYTPPDLDAFRKLLNAVMVHDELLRALKDFADGYPTDVHCDADSLVGRARLAIAKAECA